MSRLSVHLLGACLVLSLGASGVEADEPVLITFEDIMHLPMGHDILPPFSWKGVEFSGGGLSRSQQSGTTYIARNKNAIELHFPPNVTEVSFDVQGYGGSIILFEYMPIQVWSGPIGSTLVTTLPLDRENPMYHRITIPGSPTQVTIFTKKPPSGIKDFYNVIYLDNVRYTPADSAPSFHFDLPVTANEKVLIHNYGDKPYPSALQTEDRKIKVEGTVTVDNLPAAGKTIYFRLKDPEDTAPYVKQVGDSAQDDNVDGPGTINGSTTAIATSDGMGRVSVLLEVTDHVAGDNYQIEASTKSSFQCPTICPKSATYTAWKRVYVEVNKMFRRGAYITKDVMSGDKTIEVSNINDLPGPPFQLRLIHAPRVASGESFYSEIVTVTKVNGTSFFNFGVEPGTLLLDPAPEIPGVSNAYLAGEVVGNASERRTYLADAVGVVTADRTSDYFLLNTSLVAKTFAEAFVEHVWITDAVAGVDADLDADQLSLFTYDGVVPFQASLDNGTTAVQRFQTEWMARKWMRHAQRIGQDRIAEPNHHVIFTATNRPGTYGITSVGSNFNDLWLFVKQMGSSTLVAEALVHEMAHEWKVNGALQSGVTGGADGHCDIAFGGADQHIYNRNLKCTMDAGMYGDASDPEATDGIVGFHYVRVGQNRDSEYLRIRRRQEPIPQNEMQRLPPQ